ncbi:hypothetical protein ATANTOWER_029561 [Ataeniobius toweri]|uniref:Uncharacterized protein n=1 Tax=Ataeniobius toweri TaxID=208326 RepID=A0ABU7ASX0_9TELE|nr:hypothetical protein [Ataeniobius toweri]
MRNYFKNEKKKLPCRTSAWQDRCNLLLLLEPFCQINLMTFVQFSGVAYCVLEQPLFDTLCQHGSVLTCTRPVVTPHGCSPQDYSFPSQHNGTEKTSDPRWLGKQPF